ncbi:hypothetical protein CTAYLR_004581 [Chrysophaeum taylorii]|uniref:Arp2/3 complex 41 kDa subunit n=1 Tax=Chrysophaeum taylorii TaxID=2483200 RepID=A0AAD7UG68_9STRA|nr:hypothetical protein CTAYLR_004581 [Chrysophaeum taylorii]
MASQVQQVVEATVGVSCHAWSGDRKEVALCPNNNELRILSGWKEKFKMDEHDMLISAIDWHPESNFIVTCSHDRNAFVWNYDEDEGWKPSLVILRIERAALCVQWSPDGQKFAVGSSAKCIPVCYYEKDNNWWVSKMIKKHKSTVLSVAWHPNSQILASGSSDFKCRVFSAFVQGVDATQLTTVAFGDTYAEFSAAGWVHGVAYSPSGDALAFCGHDSSIHFVSFSGGEPVEQTIRFDFLPLTSLLFLSETQVVGAGHDMNPALFEKGAAWSFSAFVDKKTQDGGPKNDDASDVKKRMAMWQAKDKTGQASKDEASWLKHQGPITCLKPYGPKKFSTSAPDGKIVVWAV